MPFGIVACTFSDNISRNSCMHVSQVGFMFHICKERSTPDNSNLLGKSKKGRVIGSLKKIAGNKKILSKCMKRVVTDV